MRNPYPIPSSLLEPAAIAIALRITGHLSTFMHGWDGVSGVAIMGATGIGKSLSAAISCERIRRKHGTEGWVKWIRANDLSHLMQEKSGYDSAFSLKEARILVIDDMGVERWHDTLIEIIGDRYDRKRPTVVTTGMTRDTFVKRYSAATLRHLSETGSGKVIDCWANKPTPLAPVAPAAPGKPKKKATTVDEYKPTRQELAERSREISELIATISHGLK